MEKEVKKAIPLLKKSAEQRNLLAQTVLGTLYMYGNKIRKDTLKARELFTEAAEHQDGFVAQYMLGLCYLNGEGVGKDEKKAFELFKKSAGQGRCTRYTSFEYFYLEAEKKLPNAMKLALALKRIQNLHLNRM